MSFVVRSCRLLFVAGLLAGLPLAGAAADVTPWEAPPGWTATKGGEGGRTIVVDTLAPTGAGSLGDALAAKGKRVIVFKVGGVIDLGGKRYHMGEPEVTVAGETAPEPGITLIRGGINVGTHDVIIRHLRVRAGSADKPKHSGWECDSLSTVGGAYDVIIDHCSMTWGTDENLSASGPRFDGKTPEEWREHTSHRITFNKCIIAESLLNSTHGKGPHSMGTLVHDNVTDIAIVGNLYLSNSARNPLFKGGVRGVMVNNVVQNPGGHPVCYTLVPEEWGEHPWQDGALAVVGNYLRKGPNSSATAGLFLMVGPGRCAVYEHDNQFLDKAGQPLPPAIQQRESWDAGKKVTDGGGKGYEARAEAPVWPAGLKAKKSTETLEWVLADVGARPWARDGIDRRLVSEARAGTGKIIDDQSEVGGYAAAGK